MTKVINLKQNKITTTSATRENSNYTAQEIHEIKKDSLSYYQKDVLKNGERKMNKSLIRITDDLHTLLGPDTKEKIPYPNDFATTGEFLKKVLLILNKNIKSRKIKYNLTNIKILLFIFKVCFHYGIIQEDYFQQYQNLLITRENKLIELIDLINTLKKAISENKYTYYDEMDLEDLKQCFVSYVKKFNQVKCDKRFIKELNKKYQKIIATVALALTTSILSLSGCTSKKSVEQETISSENIDEITTTFEKDKTIDDKTYLKENLWLALLWNFEGNLEYRVIKFDDTTNGKYLNTNLRVETRTFTSLSHKYENRTILNYDYYFDENNEKYLYRSCSNSICLEGLYTIPDYNLQGYYGIIDLNALDLPGRFKIKTIYSLEDIMEGTFRA